MARISFVLDLLDGSRHLVPEYINVLHRDWRPCLWPLGRRIGREPVVRSGNVCCLHLGRSRNQYEGSQYRKVGGKSWWACELDAFPAAHRDRSVRVGETWIGNTDAIHYPLRLENGRILVLHGICNV